MIILRTLSILIVFASIHTAQAKLCQWTVPGGKSTGVYIDKIMAIAEKLPFLSSYAQAYKQKQQEELLQDEIRKRTLVTKLYENYFVWFFNDKEWIIPAQVDRKSLFDETTNPGIRANVLNQFLRYVDSVSSDEDLKLDLDYVQYDQSEFEELKALAQQFYGSLQAHVNSIEENQTPYTEHNYPSAELSQNAHKHDDIIQYMRSIYLKVKPKPIPDDYAYPQRYQQELDEWNLTQGVPDSNKVFNTFEARLFDPENSLNPLEPYYIMIPYGMLMSSLKNLFAEFLNIDNSLLNQ